MSEYVHYQLYVDGTWADGYQVDVAEMITEDYKEKRPAEIFSTYCLYLGKGIKYTVTDRIGNNECSDNLSYSELFAIYDKLRPGVAKVDKTPAFQGGGPDSFSRWVNQRLVYPKACKKNCIQGRVTLSFTIDKDGSLTDIKVIKGVHKELDKEAVRVTFTFPVIFQLK